LIATGISNMYRPPGDGKSRHFREKYHGIC
jgi:hypothetical protein